MEGGQKEKNWDNYNSIIIYMYFFKKKYQKGPMLSISFWGKSKVFFGGRQHAGRPKSELEGEKA